ncbi:MAG: carbon starvation protein A [Paludibacteraceae bacterium]|nr:carbon starvation protein A [Paludibacteraceae bacterium]
MISFIVALVLLIVGYITYGALVERVFGIDTRRTTPALAQTDGVDFVPMSGWRIFLIQFLNIAGLGPIFGAIMGIMFGTSAYLWIVFGTILAGGVHDFMSGMMSVRHRGQSMPEIVGEQMGRGMRYFMRLFSIVLLVLLTAVFTSGPAGLLHGMLPSLSLPLWTLIIFVYYILATLLPVDKLIGRFYPIFGAALLIMAVGIGGAMLLGHAADMPEVFRASDIANHNPDGYPIFPMMFVSIACGAVSGFHSTQSPLMARCLTNERQGRRIFYGAMVAEGIVALIWAAAAGTFFGGIDGLNLFAQTHPNTASDVVSTISNDWLGIVGGILAVLGVVAAPITSGDTALRSARLIVADLLGWEQRSVRKRLLIAVPLFVLVFVLLQVDFAAVWRYFSWSNQTIATIVLWTGAIYLARQHRCYWICLIPAVFMTMVTTGYIFIAPEGFDLAPQHRWVAHVIAAVTDLIATCGFFWWLRRQSKEHA